GGGATVVAHRFEDMYGAAVKDVVHGTGQETFEAIDFLKKADPARYQPANGAQYRGRYGEGLKRWRSSASRTWAWSWPSPRSAAGTITPPRAACRASWPRACGS